MAPFWSSSQKKGRAKKKIPGQIRFLPELDCISLEGVEQHFEDINFLYTIGLRFFRMDAGGRKSVLVKGEVDKENGAGGGGRTGAHVVDTCIFFCPFNFFLDAGVG